MDIRDIRGLTDQQLQEELSKAHREYMNVRFRATTNQLPDTNLPRSVRKSIARLRHGHQRARPGGELGLAKAMRKVRTGTVVRTRMDKTAVVEMVWKQRHRLYQKQVRRVARFQVHDALNQCLLGDVVRIQEVRPISKTKRWRLLEILERHQVAEVRPIELESDAAAGVAAEQIDADEEAELESLADLEGEDEQALLADEEVDDDEVGPEAEDEEE